jgi:hypothetical protein
MHISESVIKPEIAETVHGMQSTEVDWRLALFDDGAPRPSVPVFLQWL